MTIQVAVVWIDTGKCGCARFTIRESGWAFAIAIRTCSAIGALIPLCTAVVIIGFQVDFTAVCDFAIDIGVIGIACN